MGVHLAPLIRKQIVNLQNLRGHSFAVDGNNVLYQLLALIRLRDGKPLTSQTGRVTSHLVGLLFRTTRLISDYDMSLVFTFDGRPHERKREELRTRRATRLKAAKEYAEAVERRDYATAWSKAVASSRLTQDLVMDAQRLLDLLGIPWVQALGEGEAQAAFICSRGQVWASATRDYDALLYGSPRLLRYLTISGREFLPSKGISRPLEPELIRLDDFLGTLQLTQEQLIDLAIIVGTDYNRGVRGIGPHKALNLLQQYGCLENLPSELTDRLPSDFAAIRDLFLHPAVTKDYHIQPGGIDRDGLMEFLCEERGFSRRRVGKALGRLEKLRSHPSLAEFGDA
ncbi:MAG: flap endonuclease-1 [Thermoplasmata archaeon]